MTQAAIAVTVNGDDHTLTAGTTMRQLIFTLGLPERGIAVAVDGAVLPKSAWEHTALEPDSSIDILTAVQGG